ncbi:MAG: hypothetical protein PUB21_05955 [Bacteroidales bacterium]|nr:hypothetical protein [Bacteroidales bacterium]
MKTFNLFIACSAIALNAMAVEYPDDWQNETGCYYFSDPSIAPSSLEKKQATAEYLGAEFDMEYDFIEPWETMTQPAKRISNYVGETPKANDGVGEWKAGFDDMNLYVFVQYEDDQDILGTELVEVAVAPYDKLESDRTFGLEGLKYVRWAELGAFKVNILENGPTTVLNCQNDATACTAADDAYGMLVPDVRVYSFTDKVNAPKMLQWIIAIPLEYLSNQITGDIFDYTAWKAACDGKGMSFDLKFKDTDTGGVEHDYWWNTNSNDGYYSASYAGYLAPSNMDGAIDGADVDTPSNIKITSSQIELTEAGNVQILSAAGMLIKSVNDVTVVPTTDLPAGTYIVVSGSEAVTFVK